MEHREEDLGALRRGVNADAPVRAEVPVDGPFQEPGLHPVPTDRERDARSRNGRCASALRREPIEHHHHRALRINERNVTVHCIRQIISHELDTCEA